MFREDYYKILTDCYFEKAIQMLEEKEAKIEFDYNELSRLIKEPEKTFNAFRETYHASKVFTTISCVTIQ